MPPSSAPSSGGFPLRPFLGLLAVVLVVGAIIGMLGFPTVAMATSTVQTLEEEVFTVPPLPEIDVPSQRSLMFDADGNQIGFLVGEQNRTLVTLEQIPDVMEQAVIATEDQEFYSHPGIDSDAIVRALFQNLQEGDIEQGGSTITQQYVKNAILSPKQTIGRKIKEAMYARELEQRLGKDEILERYLNLMYLGNGTYGVAAATQYYFGKPIGEITLPEAALLAGMIRKPIGHDPIDNPDEAKSAQETTLDLMVSSDKITQEEADRAAAIPLDELLNVTPLPPPEFPFFTEYVKSLLLGDSRLGENRADRIEAIFSGGLRIHTTLKTEWQRTAIESIKNRLENPLEDPLGGLVTVDPQDGKIRALAVGPKGFGECDKQPSECEVTKVLPLVPDLGGSGRQVGSAFKPIVDAAALDNGFDTTVHFSTESGAEVEECPENVDGRTVPWTPENYSETGRGVLDMPDAIRLSNNVWHAKMIAELGPEKAVEMAHRLGIGTEIPPVCAIALGAGSIFAVDMAQAFGTFANGGVRCEPYAISKVTDAEGNVLFQNEPQCEQVLDEEVAATMATMMREVVERGTATRAYIPGFDIAGKTGTTNDFKDAWFVGYTSELATAAWVGYEIPKEMVGILGFRRVAGGTVPAQIWESYMSTILEGQDHPRLPTVSLDRYVPPPPPEPEDDGGDDGGSDDDGGGGSNDGDDSGGGGGNGGGNGNGGGGDD
ncbi:MAG: transglycosylase domain-containing protein [Nitriliruptorales bacterium]|nr:transglycosylase domain-containing protein [Nitriliruptorales bacterium]